MAENQSTTEKPKVEGQSEPANGLAIAALITGILGMGIVPIVLGVLGLKRPGGRGMSIAGIVLGVLSLLVTLAVILMFIIGFGFAANEVNRAQDVVNEYQSEQQEKISSKKDFAKGETAQFGDLAVTAEIVNENFKPENQFYKPAEGKKFVVVKMQIKNTGDETESVSSYSFKLEDNQGVVSTPSFVQSSGKALGTNSLAAGGNTEGEVVYEVDSSASSYKLTYEDYAYNYGANKSETLKYTLAL